MNKRSKLVPEKELWERILDRIIAFVSKYWYILLIIGGIFAWLYSAVVGNKPLIERVSDSSVTLTVTPILSAKSAASITNTSTSTPTLTLTLTPASTPTSTSTPTNTFTPTRSPTLTPTPRNPTALESVQLLLDKESNAAKNCSVGDAIALYSENAILLDARNAQPLIGKEQIRQRYENDFSNTKYVDNIHFIVGWESEIGGEVATVKVQFEGTISSRESRCGRAVGVLKTIRCDEIWIFANVKGTWKILAFIGNLKDCEIIK